MKFLVALDGSGASFNALRTGCGIAARIGASVTALFVNKGQEYSPDSSEWPDLREKISGELEALGNESIHEAYRIGREFSVATEGIISNGMPASEILRYANERGIIRLIGLGHSSKRKGMQEFAESTARSVVSQTSKPVLVTGDFVEVRTILIAVDSSETSKRAVRFAGWLAKPLGAAVRIVTVEPDAEQMISEYKKIAEVRNIDRYSSSIKRDLDAVAERSLHQARQILEEMGVACASATRNGWPPDEIIAEARSCDLLVMGIKSGRSPKPIGKIAGPVLESQATSMVFVQ